MTSGHAAAKIAQLEESRISDRKVAECRFDSLVGNAALRPCKRYFAHIFR